MDLSAIIHGRHATASPCGSLLAASVDNKIRIHFARDPERCLELKTSVTTKDSTGLRWSPGSSRVAVVSPNLIEVVDLEDPTQHVRLDNGSGSLGALTGAEFTDNYTLLTFWEFGQVKSWDLTTGEHVVLPGVKTTCDGPSWQIRSSPSKDLTRLEQPLILAILTRSGAEDHLNILTTSNRTPIHNVKLATNDAQSLSWSPDGRWLAIRDTPVATSNAFIYTPDGHLFRRVPVNALPDYTGLGVRSLAWSGDGRILSLCGFDGTITCLNTATFTTLAIFLHSTTIEARHSSTSSPALVWQETISASNIRTFAAVALPVSPTLTRSRPSTSPDELGVADCCSDPCGIYLASRDERMHSTIWIWHLAEHRLHAVLLLHNPIRRFHWHAFRDALLLLDGTDGVAYTFDAAVSRDEPPCSIVGGLGRASSVTWLATEAHTTPIALAQARTAFRLIYPFGRGEAETTATQNLHIGRGSLGAFDEGASEDSIFDMLSGRKPLPAKTELSYTERIDWETSAADEDLTERLDDTFHGKHGGLDGERPPEFDPLDDSQIF